MFEASNKIDSTVGMTSCVPAKSDLAQMVAVHYEMSVTLETFLDFQI